MMFAVALRVGGAASARQGRPLCSGQPCVGSQTAGLIPIVSIQRTTPVCPGAIGKSVGCWRWS